MEGLSWDDDDDYYTSLLLMQYPEIIENDHQNRLSDDDKYAQELHLQETLMSSFTTSRKSHRTSIELVGESSSSSSFKKRKRSSNQVGEASSSSLSSSSPRFVCEICVETKTNNKMFPFSHHKCSHKFCTACITKYVTTKLTRGKSASITCPGPDCEGILGIEECVGGVLPNEVVTLWDEVICESVIIPSSQRFYCPYKNCSALLMNDSDMEKDMREAECPSCRRLFCVKCKVTWHSGVDCGEFSRLRESERGREDLMLHELAKKNKWRRCPRCGFFVERTQGCLHMTCRCRFQFCYACGVAWSSTHGGCCRG